MDNRRDLDFSDRTFRLIGPPVARQLYAPALDAAVLLSAPVHVFQEGSDEIAAETLLTAKSNLEPVDN